jgi:hypothetical protein
MRIVDVARATELPWSTVRNAFEKEEADVTARVDELVSRRKARDVAVQNGIALDTYYKRRQRGWSDKRASTIKVAS